MINYEDLHTSTLEKLFGSIDLHIVRQDEDIRIIQLNDKKGISRTLGIVRFLNINGQPLKEAHNKIIAGGLLGKTLYNSGINFNKEFIGSFQIKLPNWLQKDFKTEQDKGFGFFSRISVQTSSKPTNKFLYSELIEIIPIELADVFVDKIKPLKEIDENILSLVKMADLKVIKLEENHD